MHSLMTKKPPTRPEPDPDPDRDSGRPAGPVRRLSSAELFAGAARVLIDHQGQTYTLQVTRFGKLILTK